RYERPFGNDPALAAILSERIEELSSGKGKRGIMVVGHGSRLPFNKETVMFQANLLKEKGYENIAYAFNEFDEPRVETVFDEMVSSGTDEVIVLPLFISLGAHLKHDIPRKIRLKDGMTEDMLITGGRRVTVRYAAPVGSDPRLTDLIAQRIEGKA
ncbi:MAG: sirohydrochlorin cobaltochelatase, partial [Candidatus Methanoplasma sp.]|nr:sirohydrochlorin cobaltochelatase [Candidatus Methanoplasma sp.]